jgi:1-acyl-sn-glycerol-3-phosphate acyltransferase
MKKILWRIWSIWIVLHVAFFFLVLQPVYLLLIQFRDERVRSVVHKINKVWSRYFFLIAFIRIRTYGREKIDPHKSYVFAPNHTSYIDIPLCNVVIPVTFRFLGKAEIVKVPLFGYMFNRVHIPVDRENKRDSFRSFQSVNKRLIECISVTIYPEGTIPDKHTTELGRYKTGAFRAAIETGTPLVPVVILDAHHVFPDNNQWLLYPGTIHVWFLDPIPVSHLTTEDAEPLKEKVHALMLAELDRLGHRNLERK